MKKFILFLALAITPLMAEPSIVVQVEKNLQALGQRAAIWLSYELHKTAQDQKKLVVILPTGSAAQTMYQELATRFYQGKLDFSQTVFFNLDEYVGYDFESPLSHAHELKSNFLKLLTKDFNRDKLHFFGLRSLTSKDCLNKKQRQHLNSALERFCSALIVAHKREAHSMRALEKVFEKLKSEDRYFSLLEAEYMNNKHLPSWHALKGKFKTNASLKSHALEQKNIHLLNGLSSDLNQEASKYHTLIEKYLNDSQYRVICLSEMQPGPIQVAYNDFTQQDLTTASLSIDPEIQARQSCCRVAALNDEQRESYARLFKKNHETAPRHVLTLGLQEILACEKILFLAHGEEKKAGLYQFFTEKLPSLDTSSLLKKYYNGEISFYMDEKAYGLGKESSLFSLNVLQKLTLPASNTDIRFYNDLKPSFWDIPYLSKPALLDQGHKYHLEKTLITLPIKKSTVLWVKNEKYHFSLFQTLKNQNNHVIVTTQADFESLWGLIQKHQPEMIVLPYEKEMLKEIEPLKQKIKDQFPQKPILGLFYETADSFNNVFYPLTKEDQKVKIDTIAHFYHSQTSRSRFDLIAQEMSAISSPKSAYNEAFSFYEVSLKENGPQLQALESKTYISNSEFKDNKVKEESSFTFTAEDQVIAISPHPDDLEIAMGGLLQHLDRTKTKTIVFNATSGYKAAIKKEAVLSHLYLPKDLIEQVQCEASSEIESKALKSRIRECESIAALAALNPNAHIQHLRLPFYDHPQGKFTVEDEQKINEAFSRSYQSSERLFFFLPHPHDSQKTHQKVHQLFIRKMGDFCKAHPNQKVYIAFYNTPWTGLWNLYDYSYQQGSRLAALTGSELLNESGQKAPQPEDFGGSFAKRYFVFYFNQESKK